MGRDHHRVDNLQCGKWGWGGVSPRPVLVRETCISSMQVEETVATVANSPNWPVVAISRHILVMASYWLTNGSIPLELSHINSLRLLVSGKENYKKS